MDFVCAAMLTSIYLNVRHSLHELILPRSWWMKVAGHLDQLARMSVDESWNYLQHYGTLLHAIFIGRHTCASQLIPLLNDLYLVFTDNYSGSDCLCRYQYIEGGA